MTSADFEAFKAGFEGLKSGQVLILVDMTLPLTFAEIVCLATFDTPFVLELALLPPPPPPKNDRISFAPEGFAAFVDCDIWIF